VNLRADRADAMAEEIVTELVASEHQFTARELCKGSKDKERNQAARAIREGLAEKFNAKSGSDIRGAIEMAKFRGLLIEKETTIGKTSKLVLIVPEEIRGRFQTDQAEKEISQEEPTEKSASKSGGKRGKKA
jgi:hypothetical protein